jgi:hypothetical protein
MTESGSPVNNVRWYDHRFTLVLQGLTRAQVKTIVEDFIESERRNLRGTISEGKIGPHGYINFKSGGEGNPDFNFNTAQFTVSRLTDTDLWTLNLQLSERVEVDMEVDV